mgnify:FL=1
MPAESRLTDEEIEHEWNAAWTELVSSQRDPWRVLQSQCRPVFARRIERIVAERMRGAHCEGCHVPNICWGFLRDEGAGDDTKGGKRG